MVRAAAEHRPLVPAWALRLYKAMQARLDTAEPAGDDEPLAECAVCRCPRVPGELVAPAQLRQALVDAGPRRAWGPELGEPSALAEHSTAPDIVCASALQVSASLLQLYSNGRSARVCLACIAVMP